LQYLYFVIQGMIQYGTQEISKEQSFGFDLIYPKTNTLLQHDLITLTKSKLARLSLSQLDQILDNQTISQAIQLNKEISKKRKIMQSNQFQEKYKHIALDDLVFQKKLGEGQFGLVNMVHLKSDPKQVFALKTISKKTINDHNIGPNVVLEKKVMEIISFPFIMKLFKALKDNEGVHFLMGIIQGIDMFEMLNQIDLLDNDESRFYVGSIILCLEYLHSQNIIYRDLKPENLMVQSNGYLRMIDLGTAKILSQNEKTFSVIGTPHYMAPEIV
jgi:cGMP-dependent protein kinase